MFFIHVLSTVVSVLLRLFHHINNSLISPPPKDRFFRSSGIDSSISSSVSVRSVPFSDIGLTSWSSRDGVIRSFFPVDYDTFIKANCHKRESIVCVSKRFPFIKVLNSLPALVTVAGSFTHD